jgi:diacylglycerol kinase family enzyme
MKLLTLVNPCAGNGAGEALGRALEIHGAVKHISFEHLPQQLAAATNCDCLLVGGGDGTISSVLSSPALPPIPVVPIPLGTANDLAREFGILLALKGVAWSEIPNLITSWASRPLTIWKVDIDGETTPLINYCSIGYEGAVVADFHRWRSAHPGTNRILNRLMYGVFGVRNAAKRLNDVKLFCDSSPIMTQPCMSIIISNIRSYLGMGFSNDLGAADDSKLECVTTSSILDYLRILAASRSILKPPRLLCSGSCIEVRSIPPGIPIQIDGEPRNAIYGGAIRLTPSRTISIWAPKPTLS